MKHKPANILIVDDSETDATIMAKALSNTVMGNIITTLDNAASAIMLLNQKEKYENAARPDLIILDLNMPDFDGFEFLRVIKKDPRFLSIPIITVSGSNDQKSIRECYKLGANCFITKPNNVTKFQQVIAIINEFWLGIADLPEEKKKD